MGTAAAGTLAIGIVAGPLTGPGASDGPDVPPPTAVTWIAAADVAPAAPLEPVVVVAPTDVVAPTSATPTEASAAVPRQAPAATADLAVATVYSGAEASQWAQDENDDQPVHAAVDGLADVGLDPVQLVNDLLDPDDNGGTP
jgi:hypothetical protein